MNQQLARRLVDEHLKGMRQRVLELIGIRYRELDRATSHGGAPLGEDSPIARFLLKNKHGGMHHLCYEVDDIYAARDQLVAAGATVLGDGEPKPGAHDKPVLFLHPRDFCGTLIEIEEA